MRKLRSFIAYIFAFTMIITSALPAFADVQTYEQKENSEKLASSSVAMSKMSGEQTKYKFCSIDWEEKQDPEDKTHLSYAYDLTTGGTCGAAI